MTLSIFTVSAFGIHHIKDIEVLKSVSQFMKDKEKQTGNADKQNKKGEYKSKYIWLFRKQNEEKI